jgi:ABC-2 type transport system ATP-binding protein
MLQIDGVTKRYGDRTALDAVSFEVGDGRLTGFVGGNGAGKTTTMRIILGVLSADSGTVRLGGTALSPADRRRFGYMPEERGLYAKMKVAEQLSRRDAEASTTDLLERLELAERRDDTVESLSLGNQQRAQIAAALVHSPEVLILDEPFSGLDPMAVETVLGVLHDVAKQGVPVLFSSHQLDVVERLCDDVVVIAKGRIRASGSKQKLHDDNAVRQFELPGVTVLDFDGGYALFEAEDDDAAQSVLRRALQQGAVASFAPRHRSLTEIFKEVVK